jgi:hypothetical protein
MEIYLLLDLQSYVSENTAALLVFFTVCLSKICISLNMKVFETHMSVLTQLQTQTHFHVHHCAWITAAICFTLKFITVDIHRALAIAYKCDSAFIN